MKREEYQYRSKRIVHFYTKCCNKNFKETVSHFKLEGISYISIYKTIKRYEARGHPNFDKIPGRPRKIDTAKVRKAIKKF
jgi:transposase